MEVSLITLFFNFLYFRYTFWIPYKNNSLIVHFLKVHFLKGHFLKVHFLKVLESSFRKSYFLKSLFPSVHL